MKTETDVLIIGAGPTGMALSIALLQAGVDHLLIDKLDQGQNTSRAGVIHAQTLETLDSLGVSDELVARGVKVPRFAVRDRDRALIKLTFTDLPSRHRYLLMLPQNITEEVLAGRIAGLGGKIHRGCTATTVEQESDAACVRVATADGERVIRARYVVGADGMHSVVRPASGIAFEGDSYPQSFVLADVHLDWPFGQSEVSLFFSPDGLVVVAPLPDGSFRIVATCDDAPPTLSVKQVQTLIDSRGPTLEKATVCDIIWSSRFRLHHRLAAHYRNKRLLLMGDAAHVHSPAGGQGMNTGLIDAVVLGHVLAGTIKGGEPGTFLDAYEAQRRPAAAKVLALSERLTRMATTQGPWKRRLRNALLAFADVNPLLRRRIELDLSGISRADLARLPKSLKTG